MTGEFAAHRPPGVTPPPGAHAGHVLVVDDNDINRDVLKLRLELRGYTVTAAEGGAEALDVLDADRATGGAFDAVLLDVMMPDISGLDVLREARVHSSVSQLPVIMTTARDGSDNVVEAFGLGANDYVTKPIDFPVLFARLETQIRLKRLSEQKDEFLAIASHDLKNPLGVVRGFAKMIPMLAPEGAPMTAECADLLGRIVRATVTMERIVNDFLDSQALEDGRVALVPVRVDLSRVVSETLDQQEEYARGKSVVLGVAPIAPEVDPVVVADDIRVRQILENLVGNAIKFARAGDRVTVALSDWDGRGTTVEVSDTGPGIPPQTLPRLFQKYAQVGNRPTGGEKSSGVGLAICRRLAELHGGRVGARNNEPGPGTTFSVSLPRAYAGKGAR